MTDITDSSKFSEMKSIQLYSTKDEYIYAMKEDLSEWFNSMYSTQLTAVNFIDKLENGVLICQHANNVTKAALNTIKFDQNDLNQAGVINIPTEITAHSSRLVLTPGKSNWSGDFLLFKSDAKPQSFQSRDNISNFIKWCRYIAKVRECLMFETDDLILRKNEKNFILCLLEVARFGSKFGIQVPTIIQFEQEIEAEIEREINQSNKSSEIIDPNKYIIKVVSIENDPKKERDTHNLRNIFDNIDNNYINEHTKISKKQQLEQNDLLDINKKMNSNENLDDCSLDKSFGVNDQFNLNENKKNFFNDSLESINLIEKNTEKDILNELENIEPEEGQTLNLFNEVCQNTSLTLSSSSTSLSSNSSVCNQNENENNKIQLNEEIFGIKKNKINRNLAPIFGYELKEKAISNKSTNISDKNIIIYENCEKLNNPFINNKNQESSLENSQINLHNHVCSIADRCTCEKQFPVIKIGEGKYRIGNTKNIVFIRILRNHIMVRVGGGWDTLENYLNKHDPCRCSGESYLSNLGNKNKQNDDIGLRELPNCSSNILLTPVQNSLNQTNSINKQQSSNFQNTFQKLTAKSNLLSKKNCLSTNCQIKNKELDFTDAKLVVERDTQGKHIVGKIIINKVQESINSNILNKSLSNNSLNNYSNTNIKRLNETSNMELNVQSQNTSFNQNQLFDKKNSIFNSNTGKLVIKSSLPSSNSLNFINQNIQKNDKKKTFNQIPPKSPKNIYTPRISIPENRLVLVKNQKSSLKLNNNELSSNPTTTGYNSLNDDSSSDFLEINPIFTENKTKSRILKRYDKKRAITEAIIDLEKIKDTIIESNSSQEMNIDKHTYSNLKATSSPKPPPRNKKKYRKSKTTDISQYDITKKNSTFTSMLNQNDDSLEESDYESSEGLQIKKKIEKLNDSLESLNLTLNNDIKVEDDSLLFNNDHGISLSLSTTSSISNINEIEQENENESTNSKQKNVRAQWDKSAQKLEYKTQLVSPKNYFSKENLSSSSDFELKKSSENHCSFSDRDPNLSKKVNNLNFAKEQLYEMKKTIDSKINLKQLESPKTTSLAIRTTPRRVKKRSGERSMTTGIHSPNIMHSPSLSTNKSNPSMIPIFSPKINFASISKQNSSSLHNLNNCLTNDIPRMRRDSSISSSRTGLHDNNTSFSSLNITPVEFKQNKAYELRKKSILLNKIVIKNHQHDPIYSRSHPVSTQLTEQQAINISPNDGIQNSISDTSTRKRLFAKKNEKHFDLNLSIGSNGSSGFSSNSIPTTNFILRNKILASSPIINKIKAVNTSKGIDKKKCSQVKEKPPSRSKSNNDLFYELERTNSAQDLIELINNCEPFVGDLTKYKVLLSECENYDLKSRKNKKQIKKGNKISIINQKSNENKIINPYPLNKIHHKRSRSLPSYECIPLNQQRDYDPGYEEEFHEETYWQDIKTNF